MSERLINARDCSPLVLKQGDEEWLIAMLKATDASSLRLQLGASREDNEPVVFYDGAQGRWWAGRYVGELSFNGGKLRIEPRFGMPTLLRWLGEIWGVRLLDADGIFNNHSLWLWLVIAHLWSGRLIAAAKHGLPYRRVDTIHKGQALRGKLLAYPTALARAVGDDRLVSRTRTRVADGEIGEVLLLAFRRLNSALGHKGTRAPWLAERGRVILDELQSVLGPNRDARLPQMVQSIRYTPITESYRSVVDLSLSILAQKPLAPSIGGTAKSYGLLLDMAEIWELYVAKLLLVSLPDFRVVHTGRVNYHVKSLLSSDSGQTLGSLRPDILILNSEDHCLGIADAKYKNTKARADNINGVLREDLYQLSAYLSGFGNKESRLDGFLIYPEDQNGEVARRLSPNNPWRVTSGHDRNLWFLSVDGTSEVHTVGLTHDEQSLVDIIESAMVAG